MKHTINFAAYTDPVEKQTAAINAAQSYLGDQFPKVIDYFSAEMKLGHFASRKQVHFAMAFAGIQGYPVTALIEKYWPTLPA